MYSGRDFGRIVLSALPPEAAHAAHTAMIDSKIDGVPIGGRSYSFRGAENKKCYLYRKEALA